MKENMNIEKPDLAREQHGARPTGRRRGAWRRLPWVGMVAFAAMLLLGSTVAIAATDAVDYRLIHQFNGSDGNEPNFMIRASDGNLYGTAFVGGVGAQGVGNGTIFRETTAGTFTRGWGANRPGCR